MLSTNSAEFGLTIAAIPIVLILLAGCAFAVQREIKWYVIPRATWLWVDLDIKDNGYLPCLDGGGDDLL